MNNFKHLTFIVVLFFLASCSSVQKVVYDNRALTSEQKISALDKFFGTSPRYYVKRDINKRSDDKICSSGLDCAIYTKDLKVAEYLLKKGANPNLEPKSYSSHYAIQNAIIHSKSDKEASSYVDLLLKYKANPDSCRYLKTTATNMAIQKHYHGAVFRLVAIGNATKKSSLCDDYYLRNGRGVNLSPLVQSIVSARDGNKNDLAIVITILKQGADPFYMGFPQSQKNFHYTPMSYAKELRKPKLAQALYEYYDSARWVKKSDKESFFRRAAARDKGIDSYKKEVAKNKKSRDAWLAKERKREALAKSDRDKTSFLPADFVYAAGANYKKSYVGTTKSSKSTKNYSSSSSYKKTTPVRDSKCREEKYCSAKFDGVRTSLKKNHTHKFKSTKSNEHACANTRLHMSGYQEVCSSFGGQKGAESQHVPFPVGISYQSCRCSSFGNCSTTMTVYCKY